MDRSLGISRNENKLLQGLKEIEYYISICDDLSFDNDMYLLHRSQTDANKDITKAYKEHFASNCSKALSCQSICPAKIETLTSILKMNRKR